MTLLKHVLTFRKYWLLNCGNTYLRSPELSPHSRANNISRSVTSSKETALGENLTPIFHWLEKHQKHVEILSSYGFQEGQIKRILHPCNKIQSIRTRDLSKNLLTWISFRVNDKKLMTALASHPELLTLAPESINRRTKELMGLFTQKDIAKLLVTSPKVFLDDFETLEKKVEYIVNYMGIEQDSIVKCEALQFELQYIKLRHIFMKRAGKFKLSKKQLRTKNAPLNKILSRNINTYLKLTDLTEEEYVSFCESYEDDEEAESDNED